LAMDIPNEINRHIQNKTMHRFIQCNVLILQKD